MTQVPSAYSDQHDLIAGIKCVHNIDVFDADLTYGNGGFYKKNKEPRYKFDIEPLNDTVAYADSREIPLADASLTSIVFDPPFLTYIKKAREHNSIMAARFGGYWRYDELVDHYTGTIKEAGRLLCAGGLLIFKCQDIVHNHTLHATHINIVMWAKDIFRLKDLFILHKQHRMPMPQKDGESLRVQRHARIHHSYFLILEKIPLTKTEPKMRRKNRQIKMTVDIPEVYEDDEAFMEDLMDVMDTAEWKMKAGDNSVSINSMVLGDVEIGPEED